LDYPTKCQLQEELLRILAREPKATVFVTHDIEEAVFLADRVVVMGHGVIRRVIDVPFQRPRASELRVTADFSQRKAELWELLEGHQAEPKRIRDA
jgi:NitT/TauT family transport system ATP-binding protein